MDKYINATLATKLVSTYRMFLTGADLAELEYFLATLKALPEARVREEVFADWVEDESKLFCRCSRCGAESDSRHDKFCRECGANMRQEGEPI